MQVVGIQRVAKRRRTAAAAGAGAVAPAPAERVITTSPAKTYEQFPIGEISRASGPWSVDWERAHTDAQKVLDAIDFSKRDIVIWVPGTSQHGPHPTFEAALRDSYKGEGSNLVALEYEATWHLRRSLPTAIATLRLVLAGIAARGGDHRVLLGGESQGAWAIGEAIADPAAGAIVDRAVLLGHPWLAKHHYDAGQDPRVRVINHAEDLATTAMNGDPTVALDAMVAIHTLKLTSAGDVLKALAANPRHGVSLLTSLASHLPLIKSLIRDPHNYTGEMSRAVEYLRTGTLPMSDVMAQLLHAPARTPITPLPAVVAPYAAQRAA